MKRPTEYCILIKDLQLPCSIGIHAHEYQKRQRIRLNIKMRVIRELAHIPSESHIDQVVSYEHIVNDIKELVGSGHINLIETLSDGVAQICLKDGRVLNVVVKVEKLDIIDYADSVGVEIEYQR